jgi:hypothetical protein
MTERQRTALLAIVCAMAGMHVYHTVQINDIRAHCVMVPQ